MKTGRPATPPDLQRLRGDPRKKGARVLEAEAAAAAKAEARAETLAPAKYDVPSYLTDRAQDIFRRAADQLLPANIIRPLDLGSLARWAALSDSWIAACEDANGKGRWYLAKSKHNPEGMMRRNPAVTDMLDFNSELIKLETLLGITPLSRQAILRGLQALPKGSLGGLFQDRKPSEGEEDLVDQSEAENENNADEEVPVSPRGFLVPSNNTRN